jgi:hypothetical protein
MQVAGTDPNKGAECSLRVPTLADAVLQVQPLPLTLRRPSAPAAHATRGAAAARRRAVPVPPLAKCGTINLVVAIDCSVLRAA